MMRAILIFALVAVFSYPANAQSVCGPRAELVSKLSQKYSESPVAVGEESRGSVLEVLVSPSGSWTILRTMPNGVSCLLAAGENWETIAYSPKSEKI